VPQATKFNSSEALAQVKVTVVTVVADHVWILFKSKEQVVEPKLLGILLPFTDVL
jgi:hypothetical protein